ncbi:MAG: SprT-like domain-containing protein [Salinigranum sp.]
MTDEFSDSRAPNSDDADGDTAPDVAGIGAVDNEAADSAAVDNEAADSAAVDFDGVDSHDDLVRRSAAYCERAVAAWGIEADLDLVDWEVSTRAKRRAAAVKRPKIPGAAVGVPVDWTAVADVGTPSDGRSVADVESSDDDQSGPGDAAPGGLADAAEAATGRPPRCTVSLTWAAFREFSAREWAETLRHELVHVEQFQRFGTTDHGPEFRRRADELDAGVRCRTFAAPKYVLRCEGCGEEVARRYRECKLVREHRSYVSGCCEAALLCERPDGT